MFLADNGRIFVEAQEWMNKTRGQAEFRVILDNENGTKTDESFLIFAGVHDSFAFVQRVFPWADATIDKDFYEKHEEIPQETTFTDENEEGDEDFVVDGEITKRVRPYTEAGGGEVALYRYELELNDIGKAFATMMNGGLNLTEYPPYYVVRELSR